MGRSQHKTLDHFLVGTLWFDPDSSVSVFAFQSLFFACGVIQQTTFAKMLMAHGINNDHIVTFRRYTNGIKKCC